MNTAEIQALGKRLTDNLNKIIVGKESQIFLAVTTLFAGGHLLFEDIPGTGKTILARGIAKSVGGTFCRIQFTPDLLPADLTGINYFNVKKQEFEFLPGPVFANIVLADEINRATPKTQSGLLECMEERQVTVDGRTYPLAAPYMVIATQNPIDTQGVFPLPEAQLDRFLIRLSLGYPDFESAVSILSTHDSARVLETISPVVSIEEIIQAQERIQTIGVHEDLLRYIVRLTEATRSLNGVILGVSQRGSLALLRFCKAYAALNGRDYIIPDDVKACLIPVFSHRLILSSSERIHQNSAAQKLTELLKTQPVPTEYIV
ncbi:MAG: AAA family ATPase [Lachnospiraceae bacterium]